MSLFDQQIKPALKKFEPQLQTAKLRASEALDHGRILSQTGYSRALQLQAKAVNNFKASSFSDKELFLKMLKARSLDFIHFTGCQAGVLLSKSESCKLASIFCILLYNFLVIFGTVRNNYLIMRALFREIYRQQDFAPPTLDMWASAKATYERLFREALLKNPLEYTWKEVGVGSRRVIEVMALYYIGKFLGRSARHSVSQS